MRTRTMVSAPSDNSSSASGRSEAPIGPQEFELGQISHGQADVSSHSDDSLRISRWRYAGTDVPAEIDKGAAWSRRPDHRGIQLAVEARCHLLVAIERRHVAQGEIPEQPMN